MIMDSIKNNLNIIHIDFSSNDLTYRGGDYIFSSLIDQHSLISVDLSSKEGINRNRLCSEGVKLLEIVLKNNFFLEFLYLSGNSIKNEGLKYILLGLADNKTLNTLHISGNEINSVGINYFSKFFFNIL